MADIKSLIDKFNIFRTKDSILNDVAKDNGQITIDIKQPFSDDIDSNNSLKTKLETNIKDKLFNTEINNVGSNIFDEKIKPFDKVYNVSNTPDTDTKTPIDTTPIKPDTPTIEKNTADATNIQQEKIQQPEITTPKPKQTQQYKTITEQQKPKLTTDSLGNPMPTNLPKKGTGWSGVGQQQIDDVFNLIKNDEEKFNMFQTYLSEAYNQLKSANLNDTENIIYVPFSYDHENGNMQGITLRFGLGQKEWAEKQLKILAKGINDKQNEEWLSNLELPQPKTTMDKITSNPWLQLFSFMQPPTNGMDPESKRILESGQKENRLNAIKWGLIENIKECKDILDKYYKDKSQVGIALSQKNISETINNVIFPQIDLVKQSEIASIISKYKKNPKSLTPIENEIVKYYSDYVNALSVVANKTSTGYETTKAIETSLPFMADFLRFNLVGSATRGGTRAAMKIGGKGLARQIAKDTPKTIGARAFKLGEDILTAAGHTSVSPLTFTNMLEDYSQTMETNGQYTKNDLRRGVIEAFTENFSERMFGALKGILPKSNNAFVNSLFGNNPVIKSMQKHMNVGGLFEETGEEYAGAFVNTMFGFALGDEKLASSFKEQLNNSVPTILSIGITVGLPQAIGMGIDFREIKKMNTRFNVAEDNLKQYFNKENSYIDINRYSDALKSLYINLNNAKYEEDKAEIKGKIAELNKTAANLAMEKGDSNGFNLISEYSIAAQNSFYVTNKAMSELKNMSEEDRTKLSDNAINKLKNDFTNNLNWSLISRAAAKNITDQNGKQHPTCFLYTDNGVTYVLNGQKDNMFYFVDVNGNTISKSADELRNNENLFVLHLNNLLSFSNKELEDINSKFIDIAQYNAGYRYKVNDNGEIRYYTDNEDLINSNTPYEQIDRDKIESNLVGSYDLVRIDNITNAVEDMANAFAEPDAEQTSSEQTSTEQTSTEQQKPAQEPAQEQPSEEPIQEQPQEQTTQEPAQEQQIQEQTTEEQETTEQEPIQPTQQEIEPAQEQPAQEEDDSTALNEQENTESQSNEPTTNELDKKSDISVKEQVQASEAEVSAFDRVKNIIIATAQRKERDINGFAHLLRSLSDEELNEALEFVNTKKSRSKIDKINIGELRSHIYYELEERDLSKNLEEAENRGYEYSLKSFENLPADFDYAGYIINHELLAENYEKSGYKGMAAFQRGLIRAVKKLQVQAAEAENRIAQNKQANTESQGKKPNEVKLMNAVEKLHNKAVAIPGYTVFEYRPEYYTDGSGALVFGNKRSASVMPIDDIKTETIADEIKFSVLSPDKRKQYKAASKIRMTSDYAEYLMKFEGYSRADANMIAMRAGKELQFIIKDAKNRLVYDMFLRDVFIPLFEEVLGKEELMNNPIVKNYYDGVFDEVKQHKADAEMHRQFAMTAETAQETAQEEDDSTALNGVPDIVDDTPQDARTRGFRRVNGYKIDRQKPLQAVNGKEIAVRFSNDVIANGHVAVIDAEQLQPSHIQGVRNPLHFIDEAQPKERNDEASIVSAQRIAKNIRPEEITSSVTAYTGAPIINARGETIQGNNRSDALRLMWSQNKDQAEKYKQYLIDHAQEFGLNAEDIAAMERPILVNMIDVSDEDAIALGQYVAQDTESGGLERIKPKNAVQKMGADMRTFANLLLSSNDDEISFAGLIDKNGVDVLNWLGQKGYITPTQYKSAFDTKGYITAEAKNDLRGIMYQSIFQGGSTRLEEMFNTMPAKAQKAILATAFRDYDSPKSESMIVEIQNSIRAYYALSQSADFMNAKTYKDVRLAVEGWKKQYQIDDATGESYLPAENFSNFALLLATMYKGEKQTLIQGTFNKLYDLIQGTQEADLFETPDNTPRTLSQAIKEVLNIDYNGQQRNNVLVGDTTTSQRGEQGSTRDAATRERTKDGERTADSAGGIEAESRIAQNEQENTKSQGKKPNIRRIGRVIGSSLSTDEFISETMSIVIKDVKTFPKEIRDEDIISKEQKSGNRIAGIKVKVGLLGNDLYIQYREGRSFANKNKELWEKVKRRYWATIKIPNATNYSAGQLRYRLDYAGTTTDIARIVSDAVLELFHKKELRLHKGSGIGNVSIQEAALRDAIIDKLREAGIDVITDVEEAQRVLDEANGNDIRQQKTTIDAVIEARDNEYLEAVRNGDLDKAQRMVVEAAKLKGYNSGSQYQGTSAFNGAAPWGNGYFLTKEERKEAWDNDEYDGDQTLGDYIHRGIDVMNFNLIALDPRHYRAADPMHKEAIDNVRNAIQKKSKTITMYRSVPSDVKEGSFRNGDWVTPSRAYAVENAKVHGWGDNFNIIEQKVPVDEIWWDGNDIAEWGYGREEDFIKDTDFAYKNTKNNRKLLDAVTYDDNGNVIPLSKRFNESKSDIRFFRTADGNAYGFTVGGKIYIDQRIATADTPIHEYAHLWASAMQKLNPNEWANIVKLMKGTPIWEEVKRNYPELTTDNEIADEVLAFYSGSRGAERLSEEHTKILKGNGNVVEKVKAINAIKRVKEALKRFWKNVAEWFGIHFTTAEEVADKVLSDLLNGVNPTLAGVENDIRFEENSEEADIVARAKADGTYMKAPNGKKSNLSPRQWVQVRTKAFKDWFGDWENDPDNSSKVVDENGEPMVVYHGTTNDETEQKWNEKLKSYDTAHKQFTIFRRNTGGERNYGMFFNSDMDNAFAYGYYTYSVYLNIKNPLEIDCNNSSYDKIRYNGEVKDTYEWAKWAEKNGYDGVIFRNIRDGVDFNSMNEPTNDYVTFASNQIKSATDNVGTFDKNNPDIRYRRAYNRSVISSRFERQAEIQREEKNTKSAANIVLGNANVVLNDTNIFDEQYQNAIDNNLIDENVSPLIDSFGITWGYQLKNGVIVINKDVFVSDILDKRVKDNLSLLISSLMKTNKTFFKEGISFFKKLPIWVLYKNDTKSNEDTIKEIINDILLGNTSIDTNKLELLKQYTVQDMNDILDNATKWFEKFEGISSNMFAGNSISDILDTTLGDLMPKEITTTQEGKRLNWFSKLGIDIRSKLFDSLDWFRVVSDKTKDKTASELYDAMIVHTKRVQGKIDIFDKEYVRPIIDTIQSMLGKDFGNSTLSLDLIQEYFAIKSLLGRTASLYKEKFELYLTNHESKKPPMFDEFKQIYDEITEDEIRQRINEMGEKSSMSILQKVDIYYLMEDVRRTLAAEMFVKQYVYSSANTLNQGLQGEQSLGLINEVTNEPYSELYQLLYSDEQSSQTMHSPIEIIEQADILIDRAGLRNEFDFIGNQIQAILNYVNIERVENGLMSYDTFAKRQLMKDFVNQRGENSSEGNLYEITAKQKANEKMKGKDWFNPNSITSIIAVAQTEIATMEKELLAQRLSYFLTNPNNFDVLSQYGMIIDEKEILNEELSEDERNSIMDKNIVLLYGERHTDKNTKGQVDKKKINILKRNDDGTFTKVTISFDNKFIGLEEFVKFVNNNFKYEELRGISKAVAPFTAWTSRIYTILSPLFPTKNLFKDLMVTPWLPAKELNGKNSQYAIKNFYNVFNNLSFILKMSFTEKSFSKKGFENKLKARSQELFEYYLEYSKQHSIFSIEDQIGALSKENKTLQDIERALSGKENKFIKFTERALLIKFMQHYAELFENLHKFSAYVTLRKLGYGEERSAQIANNATLNYDRSGSIGRQLNAIIPFAKAALGGLYRTNYLLPKYNPKGFLQRVITLAVLGVMQGLMYDPDDDDISEFARKSGMVFGSFLYPLLPEELSIVRPVRALVIVMAGKKSPAYFKQELMESTIDLVPVASDALRGAFSYNPLTNKTEFDVGQLFANTDKMTAFYALAMLASYINENKNSFGKNVLLNEETNTDKTRYGRTKQDYGLYDYLARLYNSILNGVDIDDRAAMSNKIGKNGERLMTIAKEDVEFVINNYIPFGRLYAYTAEIIYDAVNDKRINKGHIPLIGGLFAQKSFGKDYYLVNNIKYELKDFTNDFSQSQIEDIKTNILVKAKNMEGLRYKALKDNHNARPRMLDKAKQKMNDAFNVFILDINNFVNDNGDKKIDFTEDEYKFMLKSFLDSPIMKKALIIGEDTLNKHTAKRVERTYNRYKNHNNENIDTDKENMKDAAKNFKKMLYDKSITEEEFNDKLNSLYEPLFQQIKLRAKFAGYSIE